MLKKLYIDVETTGLNEETSCIYDLGIIIEINHEVVDTLSFKVNPEDFEIEDWVLDTIQSKGISLEDLIEYPSQKEVFTELISVLESHIDKFNKTDKFFLVGYNIKFDDKFFRKFFLNNGNNFYDAYFWSSTQDVMDLASYLLENYRHQLSNFKLETVCKVVDIELNNAHDAMSDIIATYELDKLLRKNLLIIE